MISWVPNHLATELVERLEPTVPSWRVLRVACPDLGLVQHRSVVTLATPSSREYEIPSVLSLQSDLYGARR